MPATQEEETMPKMMNAAVVRELGKPLTIEEVPIPEPKDNQILVRIAATGICHTDLHAAKGDWPVKPKPPFIPGHEGVGTAVAIGRAVRSASRKAIGSEFLGCTRPAATARTAARAGRHCAPHS
jgi:D-arabinose 1-dehydrogenase-like Zn-dependent alcohol dehydrogenase